MVQLVNTCSADSMDDTINSFSLEGNWLLVFMIDGWRKTAWRRKKAEAVFVCGSACWRRLVA